MFSFGRLCLRGAAGGAQLLILRGCVAVRRFAHPWHQRGLRRVAGLWSARGRPDLHATLASSTLGWDACSGATAHRLAAHPHATAPSTKRRGTTGSAPTVVLTGRWRCARAQAPFAVAPEAPSDIGVDKVVLMNRSGRPRARAGERARRHWPGARLPSETVRELRQQAATRQCTARHRAPAPPTVPRETLTHRSAAPPARLQDACPSSPSTPPPA